jgi:uncharacterized protein
MPFMIYTLDEPNGKAIRAEYREGHFAFLEKYKDRLISSGGLMDDEAKSYIGACILLDVDTREAAEAIMNEDPFVKAKLAKVTVVMRWNPRYLNGKLVG